MPSLALTVAHALGRPEAVRRLKQKAEEIRTTYAAQVNGLQEQWQEDQVVFSFTTVGMRFQCQLHVDEDAVRLRAELPLFAMAFRPMVERRVQEELGELLAS